MTKFEGQKRPSEDQTLSNKFDLPNESSKYQVNSIHAEPVLKPVRFEKTRHEQIVSTPRILKNEQNISHTTMLEENTRRRRCLEGSLGEKSFLEGKEVSSPFKFKRLKMERTPEINRKVASMFSQCISAEMESNAPSSSVDPLQASDRDFYFNATQEKNEVVSEEEMDFEWKDDIGPLSTNSVLSQSRFSSSQSSSQEKVLLCSPIEADRIVQKQRHKTSVKIKRSKLVLHDEEGNPVLIESTDVSSDSDMDPLYLMGTKSVTKPVSKSDDISMRVAERNSVEEILKRRKEMNERELKYDVLNREWANENEENSTNQNEETTQNGARSPMYASESKLLIGSDFVEDDRLREILDKTQPSTKMKCVFFSRVSAKTEEISVDTISTEPIKMLCLQRSMIGFALTSGVVPTNEKEFAYFVYHCAVREGNDAKTARLIRNELSNGAMKKMAKNMSFISMEGLWADLCFLGIDLRLQFLFEPQKTVKIEDFMTEELISDGNETNLNQRDSISDHINSSERIANALHFYVVYAKEGGLRGDFVCTLCFLVLLVSCDSSMSPVQSQLVEFAVILLSLMTREEMDRVTHRVIDMATPKTMKVNEASIQSDQSASPPAHSNTNDWPKPSPMSFQFLLGLLKILDIGFDNPTMKYMQRSIAQCFLASLNSPHAMKDAGYRDDSEIIRLPSNGLHLIDAYLANSPDFKFSKDLKYDRLILLTDLLLYCLSNKFYALHCQSAHDFESKTHMQHHIQSENIFLNSSTNTSNKMSNKTLNKKLLESIASSCRLLYGRIPDHRSVCSLERTVAKDKLLQLSCWIRGLNSHQEKLQTTLDVFLK